MRSQWSAADPNGYVEIDEVGIVAPEKILKSAAEKASDCEFAERREAARATQRVVEHLVGEGEQPDLDLVSPTHESAEGAAPELERVESFDLTARPDIGDRLGYGSRGRVVALAHLTGEDQHLPWTARP